MLKAIHHEKNLTKGTRDDIGIITLWTRKEAITKHLKKEAYGFVGQLYSKDEGISYLIRNCLANKTIRHLILLGVDLYNSGDALIALINNGIDENHNIIGISNAVIHKEIPKSAIDKFRKHIKIHDYRSLKEFKKLNSILSELKHLPTYGPSESFPEHQIEAIESFPTDPVGYKVINKTIGQAWLEVLDIIMRFGIRKKTEYHNEMKEVINMMVVITDEDPDNITWEPFFNFTKEDLKEYIPIILTDLNIKDVEYTYGTRLRKHFGKDQIAQIIDYLKKVPHTRRAVAVTWDVKKDLKNSKAPCLDLLQFLIQDNKLYLVVYFRSNDMFDAWPRNAFALRALQNMVSKEINVPIGSLSIISCSAHIYDNCWELSKSVLKDYTSKKGLSLDSRGNLVINVLNNQIEAVHYSPTGEALGKYTGKTAHEIIKKIVSLKAVSLLRHALYLGAELQKAELALQNNIPYTQDKKLSL